MGIREVAIRTAIGKCTLSSAVAVVWLFVLPVASLPSKVWAAGLAVEKNYYVDSAGRLLVNTPYETAELYAMQKAPNRDELEFGS